MSTRYTEIEDMYPLSPVQQGMLFHTLYAPESAVYFEQMHCTLHGPLDVAAFTTAWQQALARHPILRTAFVWEGLDDPVQVVCREVDLPLDRQDWQSLDAARHQQHLEAYLEADRERGFDLSQAPLLRLALIQIAPDRCYFVWSHHHLLIDGWSSATLLKEVFGDYEALRQNTSYSWQRNRPYRDYIAWLQQQDSAAAEAFWKHALAGISAPTPLVVDLPTSQRAHDLAAQAEQHLALSADVTAALQSLARQQHITLSTLVQGAMALLLSSYSGEPDVVFGVTVSGRPATLPGAESMIGLFINTLPLRVHVSWESLLLPWLHDLQRQQLELGQYAYSSLVEIQRWSEIPRGQPLFESIVVFENYPIDTLVQQRVDSLGIGDLEAFARTNYPLTVIALPGPSLTLRMAYDCCRFEDRAIRRMLGHIQTLLESIAADPARRLNDLVCVTAAEQHELITAFNATSADYPQNRCLHELIEEQVAQTPEAVALTFEDCRLTYAELNQRANQLAHQLRCLGVGPETRVAVCMERSLELVIALLGVLKAGAAYVPVDPSYPTDRIRFMLADAAAPVLLTQQHLATSLPPHNARVLRLDADWPMISRQPSSNPRFITDATNLAYVIYTSGSTGQPKGAMNTHQAIVNRLLWMQDAFGLDASDRVLQKTPFSFDVSVWEFFWPLLVGTTLVIAQPGGHQDPAYLVDLIAREQITTLHFVPSMLQIFLEERELDRCTALRRVICSGEALPLALQERCFTRLAAQLHNLYGPTEAAVDVTWWPCLPNTTLHTVPIGRPIANTQIYLLDPQLRPVPVGVPGELHIGGIQLARGYLARPALTAERFIPDPFAQATPGSRLYKTGDLARYLPDGAIEYLGRLDFQVKIRGYRIELGEIETTLQLHPGVREAVVTAREAASGDMHVVAYIVGELDGTPVPGSNELRAFLKERLPDYMIPSVFVVLDALPLSPAGKVDRRALPVPQQTRQALETSFEAPRTPIEATLASVWSEVLGIQQIGIHDNFFDLGGHSLLATRLNSRLRDIYQIELPLRSLFDAPSIAALAALIEAGQANDDDQAVPEIMPVARESRRVKASTISHDSGRSLKERSAG
jgi:surfactin family lipopeptide synthetase C